MHHLKHVATLDLSRGSFPDHSSFVTFVNNVFNSDTGRLQFDVSKVSLMFDQRNRNDSVIDVLDRIINYALSYNCQHFVMDFELERQVVYLVQFLKRGSTILSRTSLAWRIFPCLIVMLPVTVN
ncbi:hypothetical protein LINGRAHAP2_LOCUS3538 [Linum grandiflorum]